MNKNFEQPSLSAIQYGCGKIGRLILKYLYEKGVVIVGAIDSDPALIGQDIGDLIGLGQKLGIAVSGNAEEVFAKQPADICIISISSLMTEMYPLLTIPLKYGVNTITTCEEAFFPWTTSPEFAKRLDLLAKENYCTLTASGYQDIFWGNLITTLAGASHKITAIEGQSSYNIEEYGLALAKTHGAGLSAAEFASKISSTNLLPSYMWNSSEWLAARLGWTVKNINQKLTPIIAEQPTLSRLLNRTVAIGECLGMTATVDLETNEGPIIQAKSSGKIYGPSDQNTNDWTIKGQPNLSFHVDNPSTVELACSTIVNRIPEIMVTAPGFMTTHNWISPSYRGRDLASYLPTK